MEEQENSEHKLQRALEGVGPLLQRDYWAVLKTCPHSPSDLTAVLREQFVTFPPEELVTFRKLNRDHALLQVGDEMEVTIRMMNPVKVQVICVDSCSITLATEKKHPEAGRITFGCYRNREHNDVIFHIRSRACAGSLLDYAGFMTIGDSMQVNTWTGFIDNFAHRVGDGTVGAIHVEENKVKRTEKDDAMDSPTFIARGD